MCPTKFATALRIIGIGLGVRCVRAARGSFEFRLQGDGLLTVSPDSAGRLRLDVETGLGPRATMWASVDDHARLLQLACDAQRETLALHAG